MLDRADGDSSGSERNRSGKRARRCPETVAVSVRLAPNANDVGLAVTIVVVAAVPDAATVTATAELLDPVYVVSPEVRGRDTVGTGGGKIGLQRGGVRSRGGEGHGRLCIPIHSRTSPCRWALSVKVFGATVAVKVTASLITTEVPGLTVSVVLVPVAADQRGKRRRQVVGIDRSQSSRLVITGSGRVANHRIGTRWGNWANRWCRAPGCSRS